MDSILRPLSLPHRWEEPRKHQAGCVGKDGETKAQEGPRLLALVTWALVPGPCVLCLPGSSRRVEEQLQTRLFQLGLRGCLLLPPASYFLLLPYGAQIETSDFPFSHFHMQIISRSYFLHLHSVSRIPTSHPHSHLHPELPVPRWCL